MNMAERNIVWKEEDYVVTDQEADLEELKYKELEERRQRIFEMCRSVEDLTTVMRILAETVDEQQTNIDTIENNMVSTRNDTKKATENIVKAEEYMRTGNYLKYIGIGLGSIVLSVPLSLISLKLGALTVATGFLSTFIV